MKRFLRFLNKIYKILSGPGIFIGVSFLDSKIQNNYI